MAFIKSISGFRGTIGGQPGDNLTPPDVVACTAAFGQWLLERGNTPRVVLGRDARPSGAMLSQLVTATLQGMGIDVIDLGLSTTPTVEMAVPYHQAGAGIVLTASHNPKEWNALKFLNEKGEFISGEDGKKVLDSAEKGVFTFASVDALGLYSQDDKAIERHIEAILALPYVDVAAIRERKLHIAIDPVNSTGALAIPPLLDALGCTYTQVNGDVTGQFAHNPEPLPEHLTDLSKAVVDSKAAFGISVDPDVDRLAIVCEDGSMFGEEYTLVAVADYLLELFPGRNTVSNLSSSRALADVTRRHGGQYAASAVGEVHVVNKMKETKALIGGEGNGGVILPDLHYGRDALVGIALFASVLAKKGVGFTCSNLKPLYPRYRIIKDKITLTPDIDVDALLIRLQAAFSHENCTTIDGLKIDFEHGWVHLRKSNTEPIIRVYAEAGTEEEAQQLINLLKDSVL